MRTIRAIHPHITQPRASQRNSSPRPPSSRSSRGAARQALSSGWSGTAAEAALDTLALLSTRLANLATHARGGSEQVAAQVGSFSDTRNKVIEVHVSTAWRQR